jgi:hypothetical protein
MYRVENSNFIEPQHEKPFIDAITVIYDSPKNINIDIHYSSTLIQIYPHITILQQQKKKNREEFLSIP